MISIARPTTLLALFAALVASLAAIDGVAAAERKQRVNADVYAYGAHGPNRSYQAGPRTRIYVTKRSWLDGGTEVLPGERKFTDYAFPPGISFARQNNNRPLDRQPLYPAFDLGGLSPGFPF
ncbi:hypothetical protein [Bradyrhizobium liaoningense]|uniref:hypothetical protein n=1 Tax=Bradyrhizobium liaoningense TaxID=43992 RepID=UPI001BA531D2|nr:hypothetical protein [Bradyrhizobium liaoningense]MBR0719057.1 hypothetical protein [Bradyrhizobium liaoningense]